MISFPKRERAQRAAALAVGDRSTLDWTLGYHTNAFMTRPQYQASAHSKQLFADDAGAGLATAYPCL